MEGITLPLSPMPMLPQHQGFIGIMPIQPIPHGQAEGHSLR